ncbi:hypothetical protein BDQ12DRAFT_716059 [Crucibulum laeve]|uniref:Uncharacterized protein n=1 Tax=Crucibulum laeve TaxID=68775 RepID=A0A5C3LIZ9_9AGAR|nr:hypothetical protein BDQ12DRAFT_716059 [Crucibulum laeve]
MILSLWIVSVLHWLDQGLAKISRAIDGGEEEKLGVYVGQEEALSSCKCLPGSNAFGIFFNSLNLELDFTFGSVQGSNSELDFWFRSAGVRYENSLKDVQYIPDWGERNMYREESLREDYDFVPIVIGVDLNKSIWLRGD